MNNPEQKTPSYADLIQQNETLLQELSHLKADRKAFWMTLAGTNRRLQMSSAAIKAAVSSLLNYDIFWDGANQHEFLETINTSVDQANKVVKLLTLIFHLQAGNLILRREPHVLQEIVSVVQDHAANRFPSLVLGVTLPQEGNPVLVDYDYLVMVLEFLLEVIEQMGIHRIGIQLLEETNRWLLQFEGLDADTIQILQKTQTEQPDLAALPPKLSSESLLRLQIVDQILRLQEIQVEFVDYPNHHPKLRLAVPVSAVS